MVLLLCHDLAHVLAHELACAHVLPQKEPETLCAALFDRHERHAAARDALVRALLTAWAVSANALDQDLKTPHQREVVSINHPYRECIHACSLTYRSVHTVFEATRSAVRWWQARANGQLSLSSAASARESRQSQDWQQCKRKRDALV